MVGPKGELKMGQKDLLRSAIIITALGLSLTSSAAESINSTPSDQPLFQTLSQAQWKKMLPDLGRLTRNCHIARRPEYACDPIVDPNPSRASRPQALALCQRDAHHDHRQGNVRM